MKKCLLSILAGALLIVSCQNYDDQFDDLNSQITALASQVAGLSKVQSDLTALAGQVNSLEGTISAQVDSALSSGLAGINETVATLEAQIEGIASSEEVAAIAEDVTAAQEDLTELLNNSNVFTGTLTISTPSQLSAALAFGTKINIVNGDVDITHETTMDSDSLQIVVDRIQTVVGDLSYVSQASTIKEITFNELTGVTSLTAKGVGYQFAKLEAATNVYLNDSYKSKVKVIAFDAMTSVTSLNTRNSAGADTAGTIAFNKATNLHLTALKRYPGASLTLRIDEGGVIKIDALDNVDALGKKNTLNLYIEGPSSVNYTKFTKGTITVQNVAQATIDNNTTGLVILDGVVGFNSNSAVALTTTSASDLETLNITGVKDAAGVASLAISFPSANDLSSLTLAGDLASVSATSCGNLASVTITAAVVAGVTLTGNTDLTTVALTGSSMTGLTFTGNSDMESLTVDTTWSGTAIDGSLTVGTNASLTSLTVSSDNLNTLSVTSNDDLATVNFTGVTKIGASGTPSVNIYGNDLTATAVDAVETPAVAGVGVAGDTGSWTTTSGMETLKTYLAAVDADANATAYVMWDTVESFTDEALAETTDILYDSTLAITAQAVNIKILELKPNTGAGALGEKAHKVSYLLTGVSNTHRLGLQIGGTDIFAAGTGVTYFTGTAPAPSKLVLAGNKTIDLAAILNSAHTTRASATDVTLTAALGGGMANTILIKTVSGLSASTTVIGERYTTGALLSAGVSGTLSYNGVGYSSLLGADDYATLTVGSNSVTATGATTGTLGTALQAAWVAKYGIAGTASASSNATVMSTPMVGAGQGLGGQLTITGVTDSRGNSVAIGLSVTVSGTAGTGNAGEALEWVTGATLSSADNTLISDGIIISLESTVAGVLLDKIVAGAPAFVSSSTLAQLTTTVRSNSSNANELDNWHAAHFDAADCRLPEDGVSAGTDTSVSFTRVQWFS